MVSLEVPSSFTLSASLGTPRLTINHDVAADLDSTNAFEGPEKLLEVWFSPSPDLLPAGVRPEGLKAVSEQTWTRMLGIVHCEVLSVVRHPNVDAYLLSESSMFVFPHKIILKTCGTTTLLLGLHTLLNIAAVHAGFPYHNANSIDDVHAAATPHRVFYSRKRFLFPDQQHGPHRSWDDEVKFLDNMFEQGSAYMLGKMNGDHWYLYITSPMDTLTPPRTPDSDYGYVSGRRSPPAGTTKIPTGLVPPMLMNGLAGAAAGGGNDETLEILMTDLDPENAKQFYMSRASAVASERIPAQAKAARQLAHESLGELAESPMGPVSGEPTEGIFAIDDCGDGNGHGPQTLAEDDAVVGEALTTEGHALGTVVAYTCGLSEVYPASEYPEARIDAYLFQPCGFSANAVIPVPPPPAPLAESPASDGMGTEKAADGLAGGALAAHYFSVHVTPEPGYSFASFETNVPGGQNGRETADIVEHVVGIFRPGRFSVTLFETKGKGSANPYGRAGNGGLLARKERGIPGYRRIDRIVHDFEDYDLVFRYYERDDCSIGGGASVGEDI